MPCPAVTGYALAWRDPAAPDAPARILLSTVRESEPAAWEAALPHLRAAAWRPELPRLVQLRDVAQQQGFQIITVSVADACP